MFGKKNADQGPKPPIYKRKWFIVIAVLFLLGTIGNMIGGESDDPAVPDEPQAAAEPAAAPEPVPEAPEPEPEPEPEPPPAPLPIPDAILYSGSGDDVIQVERPEEGPLVMRVTGNASAGHFAVRGYDANDNYTELFVNTTEAYEGITVDPPGTTVMLEISAAGSWTIESMSLRACRVVEAPGSISGQGDDVILVEGSASTADITGNSAANHFAVRGFNPSPNLMVNTTDVYDGTVRFPRDTYVLEITAVGDWTIDLK